MVKAKMALFGQIWAQRQTHNGAQSCTIPPNRAQPGPDHRRQSMPYRPQDLGNAIPVVQSPLWGEGAAPSLVLQELSAGVPPPGELHGIEQAFRALRHRNFRLFAAGQIVSLVGTWMQTVAQAWLVYRLTHSELLLGTACIHVPTSETI